jgi:hypothetical protein
LRTFDRSIGQEKVEDVHGRRRCGKPGDEFKLECPHVLMYGWRRTDFFLLLCNRQTLKRSAPPIQNFAIHPSGSCEMTKKQGGLGKNIEQHSRNDRAPLGECTNNMGSRSRPLTASSSCNLSPTSTVLVCNKLRRPKKLHLRNSAAPGIFEVGFQ